MLKILLVTQDDPFFTPIFFNELLKNEITNKFELKGIIIQPPLGKKSLKKLIKQMYNFYGPFNFVILGTKFIVYKSLNYIALKIFNGKFPGVFSVEHILRKKNLNVINIKNINSEKSLDILRAMDLDIIFSIAASQIFKKDILELPRLGCFNIHTSNLPKNRGMMPNFWSLYNYESEPISAITIHQMNNTLDDGNILLQKEFKLTPQKTLEKLIIETKKLSVDVFTEAIKLIDKGDYRLYFNDVKASTYNTFPTKDDVKRFKQKGLRLR